MSELGQRSYSSHEEDGEQTYKCEDAEERHQCSRNLTDFVLENFTSFE